MPIQSSTLLKEDQRNGQHYWAVVITGELTAKEDLTIEGRVDGKVELDNNVLTIGQNGTLNAQALAKAVVVMGKAIGDITATETISIRETASVEGDLVAPRIAIAEGASFQGAIDMRSSKPSRAGGEKARTSKETPTTAPRQQAVA